MVNDALIATFGKRRDLANVAAAEGYVRRAIATTYLDSVRKAGRDKARVLRVASDVPLTVAGPEPAAAERSQIDAALAQLSPQERACVVLRVMDQYSTRETATLLGLAEGSVKRYLHDGMGKLSDILAVELHLDEPERVSVQAVRRGNS